jgi:uncharacterized integral membrane protein (TIGR00698 family)
MNRAASLQDTTAQVQPSIDSKTLFFLGLIVCASGLVSPPISLMGGIIFGLTFTHPFFSESKRLARVLLQTSVVALGFGIDLHEVLKVGRSGFAYTAVGILLALMAGLALGRMLRVRSKASFLISAGTAICGGSAIAAIGAIVEADEEEMSVSLGTVFLLNSIALLIFPLAGYLLHLSQRQFGLWAALAIHDTSSVVGATSKYGPDALMTGITVKLARALWIVPLALGTAAIRRNRSRIQLPWFILLFCLAAVAGAYAPVHSFSGWLNLLGKCGLTATLFLIGTGTSPEMLKNVGWRPLLQGVLLWIVIAVASLLLICTNSISR